jgi:hypothetical protein
MHTAAEEDSSLNSNNGVPQDNRYCTESMNADSKQDTTTSEVSGNLNSGKKSSHFKQADFFPEFKFPETSEVVVSCLLSAFMLSVQYLLSCGSPLLEFKLESSSAAVCILRFY